MDIQAIPAGLDFLIVFARLGALALVTSMGRLSVLTWRVRVLAGLLLTLVAVPVSGVHVGSVQDGGVLPVGSPDLAALGLLVAREVGLGLGLGLALSTIGISMELSGNLMGTLSGGTWGAAFGGSGQATDSPLVRFLLLTTTAVFFSTGGHRMVLVAVLDTYRWLPPGQPLVAGTLSELAGTLLGAAFLFGLRAAAPVILALLVGAVIVGVATRLAPCFGQLTLSLGLNVLLLVASLTLGLGTTTWVFQQELNWLCDRLTHAAGENVSRERFFSAPLSTGEAPFAGPANANPM